MLYYYRSVTKCSLADLTTRLSLSPSLNLSLSLSNIISPPSVKKTHVRLRRRKTPQLSLLSNEGLRPKELSSLFIQIELYLQVRGETPAPTQKLHISVSRIKVLGRSGFSFLCNCTVHTSSDEVQIMSDLVHSFCRRCDSVESFLPPMFATS